MVLVILVCALIDYCSDVDAYFMNSIREMCFLMFCFVLLEAKWNYGINGVFFVNDFSFSDKRIGGTDSTNYVVKGSHREVPQELIEELSIICKV